MQRYTATMHCLSCLAFTVVLLIFPFTITKGQSPVTAVDSSFLTAKTFFENEIKDNEHLYTGKEYYKYEAGLKGFPFLETDQMQIGDIFYDGSLYKNVPMLYDMVRKVVVINRYQEDSRIQLLTEKIKYFTLGNHRFETVSTAEGEADNVSKGLYDAAFTGKVSVLIKRIKSIRKGLRPEDPYSFQEEDEYFFKKAKSLYSVSDKKSVLEVFADKKDLVKTFIRKNKLKFKKTLKKT